MSPVSNKPTDAEAAAQAPADKLDGKPVLAKTAAQTPQAAALRAERQAAQRAERQTGATPRPAVAAGNVPPVLKSVPTAPPPVLATAPAPITAVRPVPAPVSPAPAAKAPPQPIPSEDAKAVASMVSVKPTAATARVRPRHRLLFLSFVLAVLLPASLTAYYLWGRAVDQYASTVGFSVRREEVSSAMDLLGGISGLSKSSSSDTDILYEFLKSQKLVADLDADLDLRGIWSKPQGDPIYSFNTDGSIEDLVDYWSRMVRTSYDSTSGLIEVRVLAFDPKDATKIAQALFEASSSMINSLSTIAREDAISYSREELKSVEDRLRVAREAITRFRTLHQIVDPSSDLQTHAGVLGALQTQLTAAQVELDLLGDTQSSDPRQEQTRRRIAVIEARIASERNKVGVSADGQVDEAYASVVGDYERLSVDLEFAQRSYVAALASYDAAQAEARRKSRYLAAHILPTSAEVARFPQRVTLQAVISVFLLLLWTIGVLVTYSLRDRR
ncbi:MAG: capsule biosynthesis protein [Cypionkella sp.]|uniref:capsule biosynthesis protein n=1 Tax=Cypionkella sp. TaxID=2811411 RepID=UPI002ABA8537|nr:capsule biosynthesis protein [Cypionkella sp.]MDZ4313137.1 capsule biosynthesis protein [Cypionkella sp.]MDZ4393502.1 capsule biosynthesis protein [Cypionkella sp.]